MPLGAVSNAAVQLPLLVVALGAFAVVMVCHRRTSFLTRKVVIGASAALMLIAVATPPSSSKDVWAIVMYGRIVSVHHASPYVHPPAEYGSDPTLARMAPAWRHTRSVYGPAFTAVSAAGTAVAGDSPLGQRLFFQVLSALAVMLALALLARRKADAGALAFIGLNPVVAAIVVGGHNDLVVGVAILAAVLSACDRRPALAGALLAIAVLVKAAAALPLLAVVAWVVARQGCRAGARVSVVASTIVLGAYALAGGRAAIGPLHDASTYRSKASVWGFPVSWLERNVFGSQRTDVAGVTTAAAVAVVILAVVLVASRLHDVDPAIAAGGAALVYLLGAAYMLPWYAGWAIPVLALAWRSRVALAAALQAAALVLVYVDRPGVHSPLLHNVVGTIATHVMPVLEVAALVALVTVSVRRVAGVLGAHADAKPARALA